MAERTSQEQKVVKVADTATFAPKGATTSKSLAFNAVSEDAKALERQRRADIRDALLGDARTNFDTLAPLSHTGYDKQLEALESDVNGYLKRNPAFNNRTIVLKPEEFDAAVAVGMSPRDAVKGMLRRQGVEADANMLAGMAGHMRFGYESKFGLSGYTQDAETQPNVGTGADKVTVIIPNSSHADPNPIQGFSYKDNIDFFNRHESWHAKDSWYDMTKFSPQAQGASLDWDTGILGSSAESREAFSTQIRKEALGDVGAIGDMLRADNHRTTQMISTVAAYRGQDPFDVLHLSAPVLEGMKSEIDKMGLPAFRKMDERHVRSFYHDMVEKYGMSQKAVKYAADFDCADDATRARMTQTAATDPDMAKAVRYMKMKNADPAPEDSDIPLTPQQETAKSALDKYNPARELENRAFKIGGKITPQTFIAAYGQLGEELRQKALTDVNNPLWHLEMTKLQETFVDMVKRTDYVAINKRHNVNIEEKEPALSRFTAPAATTSDSTAAPAAVAPQQPADNQQPAKKTVAKPTTPG